MGRIHGLAGPAVTASVDEWLDRLGAADYAGAPLRTLSKGMCQKVAIAQALLARPGLLVLDEAWTGLDQAARGALDEAVGRRIADGGTVLFVDHDPARLAGQVSERWLLGEGKVMVEACDRAGDGSARAGAREAAVLLELSGVEAGSLARLARMPRVLSVSPDPVPGGDPAVRVEQVWLTVRAGDSDHVLRQLLAWDGVHVAAVRPGTGAGQ